MICLSPEHAVIIDTFLATTEWGLGLYGDENLFCFKSCFNITVSPTSMEHGMALFLVSA